MRGSVPVQLARDPSCNHPRASCGSVANSWRCNSVSADILEAEVIVVTGAAGRLGGAVLAQLLEHMPASEVGVSTTRPEELAQFADRGVRVRRGSYDDADSLRHAFEGA